MAVLKCSQTGPGRAGEGKSDFNRSYTVPFQVIVDNAYDGVGVVSNAVDPHTGVHIPFRYFPYVGYENVYNDLNALCTNVKPKQDGEDWQKWSVEALFETNWQTQQQQNPEDDDVIRWIELESEKRKVTKQWDGTPIVNSAGQLIDGLERNFTSVTLCFLRNELQITSNLLRYNDAINSDPFYGMTFAQGLCNIYVDKPLRRNQYFYWPHTYKIKYRKELWTVDPVDRGTAVKLSDGTLGRPISPNTNEPIDGEINLDGRGNMLSPTAALVYWSQISGNYVYGARLNEPVPFAALNL